MKHKIALLQPYFGKLPNYFNLALKSYEYNSDFDWYILTDDKAKYNYPKNVHVIYMTFDELKEKFQKNFDFKISLDKPYKLCDFKPSFGEMFTEILEGYDFWGNFDPDAIFGDLKCYITDDILSSNDKLFVKGHLSLYRNNSFVNSLYRQKIEGCLFYEEVFSNKEIYVFDEKEEDGINAFFIKNNLKIYTDKGYIADIKIWNYSFVICGARAGEIEKSKNSCFSYENGKICRYYSLDGSIHKEEFMYIHLQKRKMLVNTADECRYLIYNNSFNDFIEITKDFLMNANKNKYFYKKKDLLKFRIFTCRIQPYYKIIVKQKDYKRIYKFILRKLRKFTNG